MWRFFYIYNLVRDSHQKIDYDYRFGFNGQEKDNEVAGIGNSNTAQFWQYDTRLGRRWNLDPVDQVSFSNYSVLRDNPILNIDPNGDVVELSGKKRDKRKFMRQLSRTTGKRYGMNKKGELYNKKKKWNKKTTKRKSGELSALVKSAVDDSEVFTYDLVRKSNNVLIDNYNSGQVDVGDFAKMNRTMKAGQFAHFISERLNNPGDYSPANRTSANFKIAHASALKTEGSVVTLMLKIPNAIGVQKDVIQKYTDANGTPHVYWKGTTTYGKVKFGFTFGATLTPAGAGRTKITKNGTFLSRWKKY